MRVSLLCSVASIFLAGAAFAQGEGEFPATLKGHAVLPAYTLSSFSNATPFVLHGIHSPRIMSELNLVWSSRRPSTETHKRALALIREVVQQAVAGEQAWNQALADPKSPVALPPQLS